MLKVGMLVQNSQSAYGIVLSVKGYSAEILWGDGLREIEAEEDLIVVPFKKGARIPAQFPEMAAAYKTLRGFS